MQLSVVGIAHQHAQGECVDRGRLKPVETLVAHLSHELRSRSAGEGQEANARLRIGVMNTLQEPDRRPTLPSSRPRDNPAVAIRGMSNYRLLLGSSRHKWIVVEVILARLLAI